MAERAELWIDELNDAPLWPVQEADLLGLAERLHAMAAKLAAASLRITAEIEARGTAVSTGSASTASWLRASTRIRPGIARHQVQLAAALAERYPTVQAALATGAINSDHAAVIAHTLDALPDTIDDPTLEQATNHLLDLAAEHDPKRLAALARHLTYVLDPDGEQALAVEQARLADRHRLSLTSRDSGWWDLQATLDPETGSLLTALLDPLAKPRPSTDHGPDPRTPGRRGADAFRDLLERIPTDAMPGTGLRPTLIVTIPLATLTGLPGTAAATLPNGHPLSAAAARRLACDTEIIPAVLGSESQPLDLGRSVYAPSPALRRAVTLRAGGTCENPRCHQPIRHFHHIHHWADGGPTTLDNLTGLCGHCHRQTHRPNPPWTIAALPGGRPRFDFTRIVKRQ